MGLFDFLKKNTVSQKPASNQVNVSFAVNTADVIPVSKRIAGTEPQCNGLYPHEILMLSYAPKYIVGEKSFQGFWWNSYGVKNPESVLESLRSRGFLEVGNVEATINNLKGAELKELLKSHNLKSSGAKADLVNRVITEIPTSELERLYPTRYYVLTDIGQETVSKEPCVLYIHQNSVDGLDIFSLSKLVHTQPYMPYRDKIWGHLNNISMQYISHGDFGLYRNCRLRMATFLEEEGKTKDALNMMCEVLFYDANDMMNGFNPQFADIYLDRIDPECTCISPGIISTIQNYQKQLSMTDDQLLDFIKQSMSRIQNGLAPFTPDEAFEIVKAKMTGDESRLPKIYSNARSRFKKTYNIKKR
ncbi:MAG: SAP domain-containing protein [Oscillospiraceae bacterium]|nr:SAP domain-containing protein [Oscillospiraceae bacterium]